MENIIEKSSNIWNPTKRKLVKNIERGNVKMISMNFMAKRNYIVDNSIASPNKNIQTIARQYIKREDEERVEQEFRKLMQSEGYERF